MPLLLSLLAFVLLVVGGYGYVNQPVPEPPWTSQVPGFSFSPYQRGQSPLKQRDPTAEQVESDLALLKDRTKSVRTYSVDGVLGQVPELARKHGLNVALGAWLDRDIERNERELRLLLEIAESNRSNVVRLLAGNEALLREDLTLAQMVSYLDELRKQTRLPVSTAEPWHVWLKYPDLADHVDYLAIHLLPFWEGIALDDSVEFSMNVVKQLQLAFPGKPIVITEVGWPSHGRSIRNAVASQANQAKFLRRFIHRAQQEKLVYYVMEAFDQPWKTDFEGSVGGHWGVFNDEREAKFDTRNLVIAIPQWKLLATSSILVALVLVVILLLDAKRLKFTGKAFLIFNAFVASCLIIYIAYDFSLQYHTWLSLIVSGLLLLGIVGVFLLVLTEAHEWSEAMWYSQRQRLLKWPVLSRLFDVPTQGDLARQSNGVSSANSPQANSKFEPKVSIHVPAHEEPPDLLIETLNALANLNYSNFEVLVVDNNTANEATWKPVMRHCQSLGERFRFFHVSPLSGYKAGALNFALERTCPDAEVIAVIDADYCVQRNWLRDLIAPFVQPSVAIVQAPQDYRDARQSIFKQLCYAEYVGFFHLGMVTRNERNAIIQHGTMTMVRKSVLQSVGGWGTSTITEDTELGLRVFEQGHEATYINYSYGQGLIPDTFLDYKKQRFRWAYGAMQIFREHAAVLFGLQSSRLTAGQRYHFIVGWLPWIADGFNLVFTVMAAVWTALMLYDPIEFNAPPLLISVVPLMFMAFRITKVVTLYLAEVRTSLGTALAATLSGLALSYTIGRATLSGLVIGRRIPFFRTPKLAAKAAWFRALMSARDEFILLTLISGLTVALGLRLGFASFETLLWTVVLATQGLPFVCAIVMSLISALPQTLPKADGVTNE